MIGEGLKRIPSYKCTLPYDELNTLRENFWSSKFFLTRKWRVIQQICNADADIVENLLEAAGLSCEKDLRVITETDNPSVIYKVPNFCITDPVIERDYQTIKEKYEGVESEPLIIKCFCFTNLKEIQMEVTNRTTGKEVKEKFAKKENFPLEKFSIRLFYSGQEIKDEHMLCYHNIVNGGKIQISCVSL